MVTVELTRRAVFRLLAAFAFGVPRASAAIEKWIANERTIDPPRPRVTPGITLVGIGIGGCELLDNALQWKLPGVEYIALAADDAILSASSAPAKVLVESEARDLFRFRNELAGTEVLVMLASMAGPAAVTLPAACAQLVSDRGVLPIGIFALPASSHDLRLRVAALQPGMFISVPQTANMAEDVSRALRQLFTVISHFDSAELIELSSMAMAEAHLTSSTFGPIDRPFLNAVLQRLSGRPQLGFPKKASAALIAIDGGRSTTLEDMLEITEAVKRLAYSRAAIRFVGQIEEQRGDDVHVTVLAV